MPLSSRAEAKIQQQSHCSRAAWLIIAFGTFAVLPFLAAMKINM